MSSESLCSTCRFWQKHIHMGVCKRYPSIHNKSETDWCGEWARIVIIPEPVLKAMEAAIAVPEPVVSIEPPGIKAVESLIEVKRGRGRPRKETT